MNEKNYHLALSVQDDSFTFRKVYVRKKKGRDWQMVWLETGHWFAVNSKTGRVRRNRRFRELERKMPVLTSRVKQNFMEQ